MTDSRGSHGADAADGPIGAIGANGAVYPPAQIELFGFPRTPARVHVIPRSAGWRVGHAVGWLLLCWACIGIVMWVPPHFPWILTAFFLGIFFFVKYIRQRYTLVRLEGTCPKCGAPQAIRRPTRLALPHRLYCPSCHQPLLLRVDIAAAGEHGHRPERVAEPAAEPGPDENAGAA